MNKKIRMLLILSSMIISLGGCKNNVKNDIQEGIDDTTDRISEVTSNIGNMGDKIEDNIENPYGNYSDTSGVIDDNSDKGSLRNDVSEMMTDITVQTMVSVNENELAKLDNQKQGWGQGKNKNENNQPVDAIKFQEKYGKYNAVFIKDLDKKNVYLTFDEGYENGYTAPILDVLKDKGVSAVFFVTMPYVKANPELVDRMIKEGHIVGNHSVKHKSFPTLSVEESKEEVEGLHNYIKENYNYDMNLFRFPCGEFSEKSLDLLNQLGYKSIFWSYAYSDWDPNNQMSHEEAKERLLSSAHNGAIYLLHAVSKTNSEILGEVIDQLREKGYNISGF